MTTPSIPMKTVNYRGILVRFQIPALWTEEHDPKGGGFFYDPADHSVTLQLNVLTATSPKDLNSTDPAAVFAPLADSLRGAEIEALPNGQSLEHLHSTHSG